MDERLVQVDRCRSSRKEIRTLHPVAGHGLDVAGLREHETLLAEGHYRCPHCRRADLNERNAPVRRMR
jgi:hypothetical protein